jgi:hypothetical protein
MAELTLLDELLIWLGLKPRPKPEPAHIPEPEKVETKTWTKDDLDNAKRCFGVDYTMGEKWQRCRRYDVNGDGKVDIKDISTIAKHMKD